MLTRRLHVLLILALAALLAGRPAAAAEGPAGIADVLAKMPAESIAAGQEAAAQILKGGPATLKEIVALLVPPGAGDDARARFALNAVAFRVTRPGAGKERALFSRVLIEALGSGPPPVRVFLVSLLQMVGREEAVAPLAKLLGDPDLHEPAVQALLAIRTRGVAPALLKALPEAKGPNRVTLVRALGELRAKAAVPALLPDAASADTNLRRVALFALANIGDPAADAALVDAAAATSTYERAHATAMYLLFARRLAESGRKKECARICREMIRTRTAPREAHVVCDALAILVDTLGEGTLGDLMAALDNESKPVREAALKLAIGLPGREITRKVAARLKAGTPERRAEIVNALGRRGGRTAQSAVLAALKDEEPAVRLAAMDAAARFTTRKATAALVAALVAAQSDDMAAAQAALLRLPGEAMPAACAAALPAAPAPARVALLQILGARRAVRHTEAILAATAAPETEVRQAALKALGQAAGAQALPRLFDLLYQAPEGPEQGEAQRAVVGICRRLPDPETRAEPVLAQLAGATGTRRTLLLGALRQIGGGKALAAVTADARSTDAVVQEAGVRCLSEWGDPSAAPDLLSLARTLAAPDLQAVALRGYVRLAGVAAGRPAEETLRMYQDALAAAKRPDEKRQVLVGLSRLRGPTALKVAAPLLDDASVAGEAAAAVVKIVLPQSDKEEPLKGPEVTAAMQKAVAAAKDAGVRAQALGYLGSNRPEDANLARGKPTTASCASQGARTAEGAVDGNAGDPNAAWFGAKWPSWLRIDLGKPVKIDTAHVFFYWDGSRYYQYTVDVSSDDKTWKTVVDMSANTKPSTHRGVVHVFDPVEARYVRVSILKNSANEAVHLVEVKVYGAGTAPKIEVPARPKPNAEGFLPLFNGKDLAGWLGSTNGYVVENGVLVCLKEGGGLLRTEEEYGDFLFRFEFRLTPGANNGIGIRFTGGNPAYSGMEIQVLDDTAEVYKSLQPYQYHGSIYGVVPCERGHQKPVGEWNTQEILADGSRVAITLNGHKIVDADLAKLIAEGTPDHQQHPGLKNTQGFIGFLGHGARVEFRNIRVKEIRPLRRD